MHSKISFIAVLIILLLTLCACTNNPLNKGINKQSAAIENSDAQMTFVHINNPKEVSHNSFNIFMPGDWNEVSINGAIVYLPKESEVLDLYSEKIAIAVTFLEADDKRGLESLMADNEAQMTGIVKNLNIYSREKFTLGPLDGLLIKGNYSIMNLTIEFTKISALQDNRFYRFEITCTKTPCEYIDIYYEMANSFEPKNFEPKK
jgi:hypothetical protein